MLDQHVLLKAKELFDGYADDVDSFKDLFFGVDDAILEAWHAKIWPQGTAGVLYWGSPWGQPWGDGTGPSEEAKDEVRWHLSWSPATHKTPFVAVLLDEEPVEADVLGHFAGFNELGGEILGGLVRAQVTVRVAARTAEIARALHWVLRKVLRRLAPWILSVGYDDWEFAGGGPLDDDAMFEAEGAGNIFGRQQTWTATYSDEVSDPGAAGVARDVRVAADDVEIADDGTLGGVTPAQEL